MRKYISIILSAVMILSISSCNSEDDIQAQIDSAVSEAEMEAQKFAEVAIKDAQMENNQINIFSPSDEILSAGMYSGKVQINDKVYTYPFTLNDLAADGIDTGVSADTLVSGYSQTMVRLGNSLIEIGYISTDSIGQTAGESVVTTITLDNTITSPEWYLSGGITKNSPKSTVIEKYGNENAIEGNAYMYYEECAEIEGAPFPSYPSNNSYKIVYDSNDKVKKVILKLDSNSDNVVEWKFPKDTIQDKIAVYISTPEYFHDYQRMPSNYGMKLYEYNGEQYLLRIFEKPENKVSYLCAVNDPLWEKPVYNYPADYSDESVIERIEKSVYEFDEWGRETLILKGNFTYDYTKKDDGIFDIIRRNNMGSHATIYGECHDNGKSKMITLNLLPCNGTTTVSEEALASLDEFVIEMASTIRFETIE